MRIIDFRTMRPWGPRNHRVGGRIAMITKIAVRVDTDSGLLGLGDVDDFMGVREARANRRDYFAGHDAFVASALVSEMIYGAKAPKDVMPGGMIAIE